MNQIIKWVASLEQFIIQDISFNSYMLLSSFSIIFAVILWFKKPNFSKLTMVLIGILCFQLSYFLSFWKHQKTNELLVFNSKKSTLISEKKNSQLTIYSDISTLKDLKKIPLVFISGQATQEDMKKAFLVGAHDYIKKPFDIEKLKKTVKTLLKISNEE